MFFIQADDVFRPLF